MGAHIKDFRFLRYGTNKLYPFDWIQAGCVKDDFFLGKHGYQELEEAACAA